jgi:hypothetical protein
MYLARLNNDRNFERMLKGCSRDFLVYFPSYEVFARLSRGAAALAQP